jgi:hypothetical protein
MLFVQMDFSVGAADVARIVKKHMRVVVVVVVWSLFLEATKRKPQSCLPVPTPLLNHTNHSHNMCFLGNHDSSY